MKKVSFKIRTSVKAGGFCYKPKPEPGPRLLYGVVPMPLYGVQLAAPLEEVKAGS
jgi:hypothetical protein